MKRYRESRVKREPREPREGRHTHFWITAFHQGKPILIYGSAVSYEEAQQKAMQELEGTFEVVALPTSNIATASRMIKARKLETTRNLDKSLERLKHKL